MRIVLWSSLYLPNIGGLEVLVHSLALELKNKGHDVYVIANSEKSFVSYEVDSIPVFGFPFLTALSQFNLSFIKEILTKIQALLLKLSPEVVNIHGWLENFAFFQCRALRDQRYPVCLTVHGLLEQKTYFTGACQNLWSICQSVNTVSRCLLESLIRKEMANPPTLQCIHNGLPSYGKTSPLPKKQRLLMVGRLAYEKCFDVGFQAFKKINLKYPDLQLTVLGDGPELEHLMALRKELDLEKAIEMKGFVEPNEVMRWIDDATLVLIPSDYESFCLVALQAALRGRAVIASRVLGLKEVVEDQVTGLLIEPKNPDLLADAIWLMLSNPPLLEKMGEAALKRAEKFFSIDQTAEKYLQMYQKSPLVSAIIPAYNGEKYIQTAIESILEQDYKNIEILVIDNGSSDQTAQIAQSFPQVQYSTSPFGNTAGARNQGIALSRGEYLCFLDQDDRWHPSKVSRQIEFLQKKSEYGGVVGLQQMFLEQGHEKPHWLKNEFLYTPQAGYLPSALLIRRSVLKKTGIFDPFLPSASDVAWFLKAKHEGVLIGQIEDVVIYRRIHASNASNACSTIQKELLKAIKNSLNERRYVSKGE